MRVSRHKISLLYILLLTLLALPITARADDNEEDDDYDVKARVVRISLLGGEVNLKRNGNKDWEPARLNYPLVEGDTISTSKDSNLEIQVDARNFIRLAANSVLRIITLRDEGIAISVVEGTVTLRLAKFDRKNGFFEIDAPKTTMAAEKEGLYRIDVPRDGRVRLTVRDGGTARIYSDTSGFTLRDGRSAELVVAGENAGDWEFLAAAPSDAIDAWVSDRERLLAQRLKYDVKYFDESVWGAEELEAYGAWHHTDDFGWIWRPHASVISSYNDWAPYRYGHWAWVPPYGWTWIGDEPWGWAPYHYGRWVYHNNYWAWAPRSHYVRKRSWWRPALVAFSFDFSFGNDICWYPLSYYQRDPHSRHYRRNDRHRDRYRDRDRGPGYGNPGDRRAGDGRRDGRHYGDPRGVTRVPRRDFGNPERRGQPVAEPVARRIVDLEPERRDGDLPRRERWGRGPTVAIPERPTGAAERAPGVPLDDDLRRSRVFRGREPRPRDVAQPGATTPTTPAAATETQPSGAIARPEPRPRRDREPRPEPPATPDQPRSADAPGRSDRADRSDRSDRTTPEGSERRGRRQETIENAPPSNTPEPRSEQPATVAEPPRETPRPERREREAPVPRSEPRESQPAPRSESPRSETPRSETPRSESPRSESPRSEAPRSESPRSEAPRSDPPRSESPRSESPRSEPRSEPQRPSPDKPDRPMI